MIPTRNAGTVTLISGLKKKDDRAVAQLLSMFWRPTCQLAYSILRDYDAAEDAAQEAFIKALQNIDRFDERQSLKPWFFRIARNTALDSWRARKRRAELEERAIKEVQPSSPKSELANYAEAKLAQLSPPLRDVLTLHYYQGLSIDEVSQTLECPRGTVASRLARGKEEMRRALQSVSLSIVGAFSLIEQAHGDWEAPQPSPETLQAQVGLRQEPPAPSLAGSGASSGLGLAIVTAVALSFAGSLTLIAPSSSNNQDEAVTSKVTRASTSRTQTGSQKTPSPQSGVSEAVGDYKDDQGRSSTKESEKKAGSFLKKSPALSTHPCLFTVRSGTEGISNGQILVRKYAIPAGHSSGNGKDELEFRSFSLKTDRLGQARKDLHYDAYFYPAFVLQGRELIIRVSTNGPEMEQVAFSGSIETDQRWSRPSLQDDFEWGFLHPCALTFYPPETSENSKAEAKTLHVSLETYSLKVQGQIRGEEEGQSIPHAKISIGPYSCLSDAEGRFELTAPFLAVDDQLTIEAPGYAIAQSHLSSFFDEPENKGKTALESDIGVYQLKKNLPFIAYVVNEEGQTVAGVEVKAQFQKPDRSLQARHRPFELKSQSDEQGQFKFQLEPGGSGDGPFATRLQVSLLAKGYSPHKETVLVTPEMKEKKFTLKRLCELTGRVNAPGLKDSDKLVLFVESLTGNGDRDDKAWIPKRSGSRKLRSAGSDRYRDGWRRILGQDRRFHLKELPSGPTRVSAWAPGFFATRKVDLKSPTNNLTLNLEGAPEIEGRVLDPKGRGIPNAKVYAFAQAEGPTKRHASAVLTLRDESSLRGRAFEEVAETQSDGSFHFHCLGKGAYDLVAVPNSVYCSHVFRLSHQGVKAGDGPVILRSKDALLRVELKDRKDMDDFDSVSILNEKGQIVAAMTPDQTRHEFRAFLLPPAKYRVFARKGAGLVERKVSLKSGEEVTLSIDAQKFSGPSVRTQFRFPKKPLRMIEVTVHGQKAQGRYRELINSPGLSRIKEARLPAWEGPILIKARWRLVGESKVRERLQMVFLPATGESSVPFDLTE